MCIEVEVLGGLLVEVDYNVYPGDFPGEAPYADDIRFIGLNGRRRPTKSLDWLRKRVEAAGQWDYLVETINSDL